jgi:hypothetical protein
MTLGDTRENIVLRCCLCIAGSLMTIVMHFLKKGTLGTGRTSRRERDGEMGVICVVVTLLMVGEE